jgi:soluble lytic murein transglycosylase-like protein
MQMIPDTARAMGVTNVLDPAQNVRGGSRYLRSLIDRYKGNLAFALAAYNEGPGEVDKGVFSPETRSYVSKILGSLGVQ